MRKIKRRWIVGGIVAAALVAVPTGLWVLLTYQPEFYRNVAMLPPEKRQSEAKKFVAQSLQLRNDIVNEPRWEAAFTDDEVNAWLEQDLVAHFADQIPEGVHEPRVAFEMDRVHFGFQLDQGPVRSVVSVVARVAVHGENELALAVEKIRAGVVPIPADQLLERIADTARSHGLDVRWEQDGDTPVAIVKYTPHLQRRDVVLQRLQILPKQILLAGRSTKGRAVASPSLPNRRILQSTFPGRKRNDQAPPPPRGQPRRPAELRGPQGDDDEVVRPRDHVVLAPRHRPDRAAVARDRPLVTQIDEAVIRQGASGKRRPRRDRGVDRPRRQGPPALQHHVEMDPSPAVFQHDEPGHGVDSAGVWGKWRGADRGWQMADGRWRMADGGSRMANGVWRMADW